jgi:hypothetical protein
MFAAYHNAIVGRRGCVALPSTPVNAPDLFGLNDIEVTPARDTNLGFAAVEQVGKGVLYLATAVVVLVGAFVIWQLAKD